MRLLGSVLKKKTRLTAFNFLTIAVILKFFFFSQPQKPDRGQELRAVPRVSALFPALYYHTGFYTPKARRMPQPRAGFAVIKTWQLSHNGSMIHNSRLPMVHTVWFLVKPVPHHQIFTKTMKILQKQHRASDAPSKS